MWFGYRFISPLCGHPISPAQLIEKAGFSPLNCFYPFAKISWAYSRGSVSGVSVLLLSASVPLTTPHCLDLLAT